MAAAMIVKQLDLFEKVDVFRIVKDMRDYREGMLYDVVREFCFSSKFNYVFRCHFLL